MDEISPTSSPERPQMPTGPAAGRVRQFVCVVSKVTRASGMPAGSAMDKQPLKSGLKAE